MKNKILIFLCFLLVLWIGFLSYNYFFVYHFKIIGDEVLTIDYGKKYEDPGIIVKYRGKLINDYKINSNIDVNTLGTYMVKYIIGNKEERRIVKVEDKTSPVIELKKSDITINYMSEYKEPGFTATDNYDGDITNNVKVTNNIDNTKLGDYTVTYIVNDSSNNKTEVTRKVTVKDTKKPEFKFKTSKDRYTIVGKKIELNDYEVIDNYDGDITSKVVVDGKYNYKKEGLYKINYTVSDSNNNESSITRTVNVQKNKNTLGIPVLMYHWFYDDTIGETYGTPNSHNYIAKSELIKQLKFLKSENYYYPSWDELEDYIDGKIDLPQKSVIITDDDCTMDFFRIALPLFQEYEIPVTSFCITGKPNYKKFKNEEYLDFESHTDSMHVRSCNTAWDGKVMCSTYKEIYEDIKLSVEKLGNNKAFAYPFGHYSDDTIKALKNNGIALAFTIRDGRVQRGDSKYKLPRVRISRWTSIDTYKNLVK